jgi:hypothetical protein
MVAFVTCTVLSSSEIDDLNLPKDSAYLSSLNFLWGETISRSICILSLSSQYTLCRGWEISLPYFVVKIV